MRNGPGSNVLSAAQMEEIRIATNESQRQLARRFGVSKATVHFVRKGRVRPFDALLQLGEHYVDTEGIIQAYPGKPLRRGDKLTRNSVLTIRKRYALGDVTQGQLAKEYGVTKLTIHNVIHRKTWKSLA